LYFKQKKLNEFRRSRLSVFVENSRALSLGLADNFSFLFSAISFNQRCYATILISHWSVKRRYQNQNFWFTDAEEEIGNWNEHRD